MRKDKESRKEYHKEYMRKRRQGLTETAEGLTSYPDIINKLTSPFWRERLEKICHAFNASNNPSYSKDVWLGDTNLSVACDWLECTSVR